VWWIRPLESSILMVNAFKTSKIWKLISTSPWWNNDSWSFLWENLVHASHSFYDWFINLVISFDRIWGSLWTLYVRRLRILICFYSVYYANYFHFWRFSERFHLFQNLRFAFVKERMCMAMFRLFIRFIENPHSWVTIRDESESKTEETRLFI